MLAAEPHTTTAPELEGAATVRSVLDRLACDAGAGHPDRSPLPTGFDPLDSVLGGGLRPGTLTLLAGKPGQGKTIAALQWARHLALHRTAVVFACYEHDGPSLLARLLGLELAEVWAEAGLDDRLHLEGLRERLSALSDGAGGADLAAAVASDPLLGQALARVRRFGHRLLLVGAGPAGGLDGLEELVAQGGRRVALFVDHLHKVPVDGRPAAHAPPVDAVAERLKQLALRHSAAVVAIVASSQSGLSSRRLHLHHIRGAESLAYDADVGIVMNEKLSVVSRAHLAFDTTRVYEFHEQVVFSIEKHREGLADLHLEFRKDFANYRFHPRGSWVAERLWVEDGLEA